jgi:NADH-quinone oxidoreductase E subunit
MISVNKLLSRYPAHKRENLIPILQEIQENEGFLSKESLIEVGKYLSLPGSKIYGVATFYNQFRFEAQGKYHIQICRGTACHVLGSATVLTELEKNLKISAGQTSRDGLFSIEVVACIGACGLAPVIAINGEFYAKVDGAAIAQIVVDLKKHETEK